MLWAGFHLPRLISLHISGTVITARTPLPTSAGAQKEFIFEVSLLYLSKPSPLALISCPWCARIPTDRKLPSRKMIIENQAMTCVRGSPSASDVIKPLASSNNNTAIPTFLACQVLIARLLLRGNRSAPGAPATTSIMHGLAGSS